MQVQAAPKSRDSHIASGAEGVAQPILVATRTLVWQDAPGSAACRGAGCTASTADAEGTSGSWLPRLMDFVVAPYRQLLPLERLAGTDVECIPETTLIGLTRD